MSEIPYFVGKFNSALPWIPFLTEYYVGIQSKQDLIVSKNLI